MDAIEHKKGKVYYSMGEVAEMFDVKPSLIRFWESKFDIIKPHKNKKGNRLFTPGDVDNLKLIYHLVKEKGMTLAGAQKRMRQNPEGISRDMEVVEKLQKIRSILVEIREELKSDGSEVYHEDGLDAENTMAEVRPARKARAAKPKPSERMAADPQAGDGWVRGELEELGRLDENMKELVREDDISPAEADDLLEESERLPLAEEGATDAEDITVEELEMLYDESEADYAGQPEMEDEVKPPFEEQSLFAPDEVPPVQEKPAEEPPKPLVVEQTLF